MMDPSLFILYYLVVGTPALAVWLGWRRPRYERAVVVACVALHSGLVVAVTMFPMPVHGDVISSYREMSDYRTHNFQVLGTITGVLSEGRGEVALRQLLGNVLMLAPLGFLSPFMSDRLRGLGRVTTVVLAASLAVESLQWLISAWLGFVYSTADVDDLLLNTLGGVFGWGVYRAAMKTPWLRTVLEGFHPTREDQLLEGHPGSRSGG